MIRPLGHNDIVEAVNLMDKTNMDDYYHGYDRNEVVWIQYFCNLITRQLQGDLNVICIGDFDEDGKMLAFMTAATFNNYYTNEPIMDVKDCIIDPDNEGKNAWSVIRLFDKMIELTKQRGGRQWRADSIHTPDRADKYAKFLQKRYGAAIHTSARGVIT